MECSEFLLTQGAGSEAMTEGLFYEMFQIFSYILKKTNFSVTTPPTKITDFCHLPLHRGGFGWFFHKLNTLPENSGRVFSFVFSHSMV